MNVSYMPVVASVAQPKKYQFDASIVDQIQSLRDQGVARSNIRKQLQVTDHFINIVSKPNPQTVAKYNQQVKIQAKRRSAKAQKAKHVQNCKKAQWQRDL